MNLNDLIERKLQAITSSEQTLLDDLSKLEGDLYQRIVSLLGEMDRENGRIVLNARNRRTLVKISVEIDKLTAKSLRPPLEKWLRTFDQVDELTGTMFAEMGVKAGGQISEVRQLYVDILANRLTDYKNIAPEITQPIKQILGKNLLSQVTFAEAERELKSFIQTQVLEGNEQAGVANRWSKQLTRDALNQYDGAIKQRIQDELQMDSFRYVGSIKLTTRENCRMMITRGDTVQVTRGKKVLQVSNKFASLRQDDGGYRIADIPQIISLSQGGGGWNPNTNADNYFINRGGYNCRHEVIPYIYNSRRAQRALRDLE